MAAYAKAEFPRARRRDILICRWHRPSLPGWMTAGLRMLDGGSDNAEVYSFARFYYGVASLIYRF